VSYQFERVEKRRSHGRTDIPRVRRLSRDPHLR
jgi:hypothetical protein